MVYPRKLLETLRKHLETPEIVVLTGMRRVGKTTLCRTLFNEIESRNKVFLDIENLIEQKVFEETDYNNIWANLRAYGISPREKAYIFLDEIQTMPPIVQAIKYLFDHYDVKFFLTGSSSFYLKNLFPESLAGRKFVFELYPLDFEEFLIFKGINKIFYKTFSEKDRNKNAVSHERLKKLYEEYLTYGGFPQVAVEDDLSRKKLHLDDIFKSYFEKDVRSLADFKDINAFRDLILLLMRRVGSKLDVSKLASEMGTSRPTVYSYLSFLEGTYFVSLIAPFSRSTDREVSGAKKVYFGDTGMLDHFVRADEGSLFENAVFNNLRKYGRINYYQRRIGAEIDFVVNQQVGVEAKIKGIESDLKKLRKTSLFLRLSESFIVTKEFNSLPGFIPATEV